MAVLGRNFLISAKIGSGTKAVIAAQKTGTITITADTVDTTVKPGTATSAPLSKTYQKNLYGWEVSLNGVYDLTTTKNLAATIQSVDSVEFECEVGADLSSGSEIYKGTGIITSFAAAGDQGDVMTYDITIQGTGDLTIT